MIKHYLVTGDTHGRVLERLKRIDQTKYPPAETAVIILGDAGLNFYLNRTDKYNKKTVNDFGYRVYCLRGNHEERPENLGYPLINDTSVGNMVYMEEEFPNIHYFVDGGNYLINNHTVLTIGGAYSVDKWHRLQRAAASGSSFSGWFKDEQLTEREMSLISENVKDKHFDFVFTHTCPLNWEPSDLFLSGIDQSAVDNTMERWLNQLKDTFNWGVWCFGHFHADRHELPFVEQYYTDIEDLEDIIKRWKNGKFDRAISPKIYCKEEQF